MLKIRPNPVKLSISSRPGLYMPLARTVKGMWKLKKPSEIPFEIELIR